MKTISLSLQRKSPDLIEIYHRTKFVGEFVMDVDGFYMYFPTSVDGKSSMGGMTEHFIEEILEQLKKINEPWKQNIKDFFKTNKPIEIQEDFNF
jgi:hypothetical protein